MKAKRALILFAATALVAVLLLLSLQAYYILLAMVVGLLLMGYREIWSLIRYRRMPVIDERIQGNLVKAVRNAGLAFVLAAIFMMLVLSGNFFQHVPAARIVGLLFVTVGAVYLFSYLYYDHSEPNLDEKALRRLRIFVITSISAVAVFVVSIIVHRLIGSILDVKMPLLPILFVIAFVISPAAMAVGLLGSLVFFVKGLIGNLQRNDEGDEADENED